VSHATFAQALLDPERPCPAGLRAYNGSDPAVRFAVYRNNVVTSLVDALADGYPVVQQLVGDAFFAAMARAYVTGQPPRSPVLGDWSDTFAKFIADFEPAACLPYLADVARLERARVHAFHAADAPTLDAAGIAAPLSDPASLARARVAFHPSVRVLDSPFAIVSLWAAHQGHGDIAQVDPSAPEAALVFRDGDDAVVIRVPRATGLMLGGLAQGATLAAAAGEAAARSTGEPLDLAASLAVLIRHRLLVAWHHPPEPRK
jgi:hypothetical protein